jgi:hypothetical protein
MVMHTHIEMDLSYTGRRFWSQEYIEVRVVTDISFNFQDTLDIWSSL